MLVDLRKCVGCHACTAGCVAENVSPPGIVYRPVFEDESGAFPRVKRTFVPRPCMHCDRPPCVGVCPKAGKATYKSKEGLSAGLVVIDYAECIQCAKCIRICPYKARRRDDARYHSARAPFVPAYEKRAGDEYGLKWTREPQSIKTGTARKCHFCLHRLKAGMLPVCATTCNGRATYFGDLSDPASLIARVRKSAGAKTIRKVTHPDPARGKVVFGGSMTEPRVFYIL